MAAGTDKTRKNVVQLRPTADSDRQLTLLPIELDAAMSAPAGSADLKKIVRGRDTHYYALKSTAEHPLLPATEFLCYKLAQACSVPTPMGAILITPEREYCFGSRWESSLSELSATGPRAVLERYQSCRFVISATLAFDLFIGNDDRHMNNFVFRHTYDNKLTALAIDFSRAFLIRGFPADPFPVGSDSKTRLSINLRKRDNTWDSPSAVITVDAIGLIKTDHLLHWMKEMPDSWLPQRQRDELLTWWGGEGFRSRLNKLLRLL